MRVERFVGSDMRQAMASVREVFGKDAVILSTRRVGDQTEIMAARDYDPQKADSSQELQSQLQKQIEKDNKPEAQSSNSEILEIQDELGKLRKLFEGELAQLAWRDQNKRQPNRYALIRRLSDAGINEGLANQIVDKIMPCDDLEQGWRKSLGLLGRMIKPMDKDYLTDGGIIALVGSTGVGKTTTAAKIAARFALKHGRKHVAFVSSDKFKVGGQEQLVSFGSILGIPVQIASTAEEMSRTLDSLSGRKLIIVDTAGMSQRDLSLSEQLEAIQVPGADIDPLLVLPATVRDGIINETIKAYAGLGIKGAVLTKIDECDSVGPLLSAVIKNKLPLAFTTNGQQVPEDLHKVEPKQLLAEVIKSYKQSQMQGHALTPALNSSTGWMMSS